jgi:hypothetical protein
MTRWHHEIFRAMPKGRLLLAEEVYRLVKLPRGWSVGDVRAAMKRFARDGVVEVERLPISRTRTNGYRRIA